VSTRILFLFTVAVLLALAPVAVLAQSGLPDPQALAGQSLRGYTHVFVAYVIAWALIAGWVISIARRLARLERALKDG
jgi:CcmD family protein